MEVIVSRFLIFCIATSYLGIGYGQSNFNVVDFGAVGDGKTDDSNAFLKAWVAVCGARGATPSLVVPAGKTFLLQPLKFEGPCSSNSVHLQILGNIVAPDSIAAWKQCADRWLGVYNVLNLVIDGSGTIDGKGSAWWSISHFSNNSFNVDENMCSRPTALYFHNCNNLQLSGLNHLNSPRAHIKFNSCNGVFVSNLHITAPEDSPNTDGIDISNSTQVNIHDCVIGTGDDCIAVIGGSSNINITHIACGPGHGISVGSLGVDGAHDTVEGVHVRNCSFTNTQNGARIKTRPGGSGYARMISFEQLTFTDAKNPVIIDQYYTGFANEKSNSDVQVSDVTYNGLQGTSAEEEAIRLDCSQIIGCSDIKMDQINITSAKPGGQTRAFCQNAHGQSSSTTPIVPCLSG